MAVTIEALKKVPYFAPLTESELRQIRPQIQEKKIAKGEILFSEGEECRALFCVSSGRIKIVKISPEGKEQILRSRQAGLPPYPAVSAAVIRTFAEKLRYLTRMVEDFSFRSVTARLAKHLLEAATPGQADPSGPRLTQQDIAA